MRPSMRLLASALGLTPPAGIRHLLGIKNLKPTEFTTLVRNAMLFKSIAEYGDTSKLKQLSGKTIAMMFNKRSTRTRISSETAVSMMGGNPMFLGKEDIQLGVSLV